MDGRITFVIRAFKRGLPWLWSVIGIVVLLVGGSLIGYVALARDKPFVALAIVGAALVLTVVEGAFQLLRSAEDERESAKREVERFEQGRSQLSFGRPEIPTRSRPVELRIGSGPTRLLRGRVVRVPVMNAAGTAEAKRVHALLTFLPDDRHRTFAPIHPAQAEWDGEDGPTEIDLPGTGIRRYIDVAIVLDGEYPHVFEWTRQSRAAGLNGYAVMSNRVEVQVDVLGSGPEETAPRLQETLLIECEPKHVIRANWLGPSRNPNEGTNLVSWNFR